MAVGAVLGDEERGAEGGSDRRHQPLHDLAPRALAGRRLERDVHGRAGRLPSPQLADGARAGEQVAPRFVHGQGQHARVGEVDRLDAVAVMDVEVEVEHAPAGIACPGHGEGGIVVDAEAAGAVGHRVVEAAAGMERVGDLAAEDRLRRANRSACHGRAGLVHPGEWRIVARADARGRVAIRVLREALHGRDVARGVDALEVGVGRRLGREPRLGADRAEQVDAGPEAAGGQRMERPEVVGRRARAVDEERAVGEGMGGRVAGCAIVRACCRLRVRTAAAGPLFVSVAAPSSGGAQRRQPSTLRSSET